ncbi:hypothetical protein GCM10010300_40180 [Streptomyces olivaceoviridis]|nr:hypothetical protein GCM10010300_40180 [Streptomyces olivaceoviridis]
MGHHLPGLLRGRGTDHPAGAAHPHQRTGRLHPSHPGSCALDSTSGCTHRSHPPPAHSGRCSCSGTHYVLLGLVVRQVTGHSCAAEAERRVIAPPGLTGTSFPWPDRSLPSPHGRAYGSDVTELDPRVAGAAGEPVTPPADPDRFHAALLGDRLPPSRRLREMLGTRAAHGSYGMGLFPVKPPCGTTVWGHNGRMPGSCVRGAATADGRRVLTFRVDTDAIADPHLEPALLAAEFCPRTW